MGQALVLFHLKLITFLNFTIGSHEGRNFGFPIVAHSLQSRILPYSIINLHTDLMNLHFKPINIIPELIQILL